MKSKLLLSLAATAPLAILSGPLATAKAIDYKEEIRPILNEKCFKCHSGPRAKGKLRMDSEDNFAKRIGGDDPVVVPGDVSKSLLTIKAGLPRTDGDAMPPPPARSRGAEAMTAAELNLVKKWIASGAKFEAGESEEPASTGSDAMADKVHTWVNVEGKKLEASFISTDGTNVALKMTNGNDINYPLAKLSPESQALAKQLGSQ